MRWDVKSANYLVSAMFLPLHASLFVLIAPLRKDPSIIVSARRFLRGYAEIEEITEAHLADRLSPFVCEVNGSLSDREIELLAEDLRGYLRTTRLWAREYGKRARESRCPMLVF